MLWFLTVPIYARSQRTGKLKATQTLFDASPSDPQGREYLLSLIEDLEAVSLPSLTLHTIATS